MSKTAFSIILLPVVVLLLGTFVYNAQISSALITGTPYNGHTVLSDPNQDFFGCNCSVPAFQNQSVGCEFSAIIYCGFQSIQLLSPNTIPTCIIEVSMTCFTNSLNGLTGLSAQPAFSHFNGGDRIFATCLNVNGSGFGTYVIECNEDSANGTGYPFAITQAYTNSSTVRNVYGCTYIPTNISAVSWVYSGCDFIPGARSNATNPASRFGTLHVETPGNGNTTFGFIMAINITTDNRWLADIAKSPGEPHAVDVSAQLLILTDNQTAANAYNCPTQFSTANLTPDCSGFISAAGSTNQQTGNSNFGLALAIGFVGDLFIIVMGLGLGIGAGGLTFNFSLKPNNQGTRFFQTLGFALLFWLTALAEAGPLIGSLGFLGWGTGLVGLLTFILIAGVMTQTLNVF